MDMGAKEIFEETLNEIAAQRSAPGTVLVSVSTREMQLLNYFYFLGV